MLLNHQHALVRVIGHPGADERVRRDLLGSVCGTVLTRRWRHLVYSGVRTSASVRAGPPGRQRGSQPKDGPPPPPKKKAVNDVAYLLPQTAEKLGRFLPGWLTVQEDWRSVIEKIEPEVKETSN